MPHAIRAAHQTKNWIADMIQRNYRRAGSIEGSHALCRKQLQECTHLSCQPESIGSFSGSTVHPLNLDNKLTAENACRIAVAAV